MRPLSTIVLLVGVLVAVPAGSASATAPSSGCDFLNMSTHDDYYTAGFALDQQLNEGETLVVSAANPSDGSPESLTLTVDSDTVATADFPGTTQWTVPTTGSYTVIWEATPWANVTWDVECTLTPPVPEAEADADADHVAAAVDDCPGTVLDDPPDELKKNRFYADAAGAFVDAGGTTSGYTIADTYGCDEDQIIQMLGLGKGHERFGITRGVLAAFAGDSEQP